MLAEKKTVNNNNNNNKRHANNLHQVNELNSKLETERREDKRLVLQEKVARNINKLTAARRGRKEVRLLSDRSSVVPWMERRNWSGTRRQSRALLL